MPRHWRVYGVTALCRALLFLCYALVCPAMAEEVVVAVRDPAALLAPRSTEELVAAIAQLGKQEEVSPVPVLAELFRNAPRTDGPQPIHPIREAILQAAVSRCGTDKEAKAFLQEVIVAYLDAGIRAHSINYLQGDREYAWAMGVVLPALVAQSQPETEMWFLAVYERTDIDYRLREDACAGHLRSKALAIDPAEKRISWLLGQITSPGNGEWDYFHHELEDGPGPGGKKEWAILDAARCRALIAEGPAALPVLEKEWEALEARQPLSQKEQRRQYGIAYVTTHIRSAASVPPDKRLLWRPADWKERWVLRLRAYEAKQKAQIELERRQKEGAEAPHP